MITSRFAVAFLLFFFVSGVNAQGKAEKRYPLGERGTLVVTVPGGWAEEVKQDPRTSAKTISFSPGPGKPAQVMITPYGAQQGRPAVSKDLARENTQRDMEGIKDQAVEKQIRIVEFKGKAGVGYYFDATDKAPKPGEFKLLRQGTLLVGDKLLLFTILSNSRQEPVIRDAMQMLQGAAFAP